MALWLSVRRSLAPSVVAVDSEAAAVECPTRQKLEHKPSVATSWVKRLPSESSAMSTTNPADIPTALNGDLWNAGGNVELFASSDNVGFNDASSTGAFANAGRVSIDADFGNGCVVNVSSLNGQDWFTTSGGVYDTGYGADNLANQWFNDFVSVLNAQTTLGAMINGNELSIFDGFRDAGGFSQASDPNISYMELSGVDVTVGLGGFLDASPQIVDMLSAATGTSSSILSTLVPSGLQVSEVVLIDGEAYYGFSASDSGVILQDGLSSYSGTYEVTHAKHMPEPSASLLLSLSGVLLCLGRKR